MSVRVGSCTTDDGTGTGFTGSERYGGRAEEGKIERKKKINEQKHVNVQEFTRFSMRKMNFWAKICDSHGVM